MFTAGTKPVEGSGDPAFYPGRVGFAAVAVRVHHAPAVGRSPGPRRGGLRLPSRGAGSGQSPFSMHDPRATVVSRPPLWRWRARTVTTTEDAQCSPG